MPLISIFIPAYKNVIYLKRLLDSINIQTFKDYEVIITDDSPGDEVKEVINHYLNKKENWQYIKNDPARGMPQNWNFAWQLCKGDWIKIMHDDDWFSSEEALEKWYTIAMNSKKLFVFSAYNNCFSDNTLIEKRASKTKLSLLAKEPMTLLSENIIGPPSVCMVHHSIGINYDDRLKWRVDIDYYIRILQQLQGQFHYIDQSLINVGMGIEQVTNAVKYNKSVEIPEALILLEKYGTNSFKNIVVYDAWWRMLRNLDIRKEEDINLYSDIQKWPKNIKTMIRDIHQINKKWLKVGALSKLAMFISYLKNKGSLDHA